MASSDPIGVFDSGIGGISVLRWIRRELPCENCLYIADSGHLPYGEKPKEYVEERAIAISRFLVSEKEAKAIVVACNTATAASVATLRSIFHIPIIGMEPGVKPAFSTSKSGIVGVMATQETLKSQKFMDLSKRFANNGHLVLQDCPGLAEQVEKKSLSDSTTREIVEHHLSKLLANGADTIVLGCTHYSFLYQLIKEIAGPEVNIIDTGTAIAKELKRRLIEEDLLLEDDKPGLESFLTTGDLEKTERVIKHLWESSSKVSKLDI